ncbi:MAG: anti-sigma F factor [Candidatus Pelethousia sp.]|nr:anti-sigma F factor [Candidatus Pelethousia sp.]
MFENHMELRFCSISQNEALARTVAAAFATQLNPTIEELTDIRTAVSEAVTNAIIHGYENRPDQIVCMCCKIEEGSLITIRVRDEGKGIENVDLARQPFYTTQPDMERSGMGFSVMEAFMDQVWVESAPGKGTTVTLQKRLQVENHG